MEKACGCFALFCPMLPSSCLPWFQTVHTCIPSHIIMTVHGIQSNLKRMWHSVIMETRLQPIYQQISSLHKNLLNGLFATDVNAYIVRLNHTQDNTESNEYIIHSIGTTYRNSQCIHTSSLSRIRPRRGRDMDH